jgi:hypothetical protein
MTNALNLKEMIGMPKRDTMKKKSTLTLAAVLLSTSLIACGQQTATVQTSAALPETVGETSAASPSGGSQLETLKTGQFRTYDFDSSNCSQAPGAPKICVAAALLKSGETMVIKEGTKNYKVQIAQITKFCTNHRDACEKQALANWTKLKSMTTSIAENCEHNEPLRKSRRLINNRQIRFLLVSAAYGMLLSLENAQYGLKPEEGNLWSNIGFNQLTALLELSFADLAGNYILNNNFDDTFVKNTLIFSWGVIKTLPPAVLTLSGHTVAYFRTQCAPVGPRNNLVADIENALDVVNPPPMP